MGRGPRALVAAWVALTLCFAPARARADDSADEADLRFQLGTEAYQRGEYRDALQHFLASNRLVANKNVVFNIAHSYEKLKQYPEAYRYFTQALAAEKDAAQRARIEAALEQIKAFVAVLDVVTQPPGATIYVDRVDLGPRGESPRQLGLVPGRYKVIVKRAGYEPLERVVRATKVGSTVVVNLRLVQILGDVRVEGAAGADVRADDEAHAPLCTAPCLLRLPPGVHTLYVGRPGFRTDTVPVEVKANQTVTVRPEVEALEGELVVSTDEPGALIEVDGRPAGFTPTIVRVPVGNHRVRLGLRGFRNIERSVTVRYRRQTRIDETLTQSEEVIAASRSTQPLEDAPSSVTLIPEKELRVMAYPTVVEAVRGVRGTYVWDDRAYNSVGIRGLGRLGSYGNRLLVLVDGQPINDDWIGSSYVGYDARTDLADIERIEVVRGPGSVLYGTNAFSGVINLVTRSRGMPTGGEVGASTNLDGVARGRARANVEFSREAGMWTSVAAARSSGRDFYFPEYFASTQPDPAGNSRGADGFRAGSFGGRAWWRFVNLSFWYHTHDKSIPTGQYATLIDDPRTHQRDTRIFVEATAEPKLGDMVSTYSRVHFNHYRFFGEYDRLPADGGLETDTYRGSWLGAEQRLVLTPGEQTRFTLGAEGQLHFQVEQHAEDGTGVFLDDTGSTARPYQLGAAYALADLPVTGFFRVSGGARFDAYSTFGNSLNPRVALLFRPYPRGNLKILAGKAFRAPSVYELYYNDGGATEIASPGLSPENMYSSEVEFSHRFSPTVLGTVATFANYVRRLIGQVGGGTPADPLRYENSGTPVMSVGAEAELRREWRQGWMLAASYSFQHSTFLADESLGAALNLRTDPNRRNVANAPEHMATLKGAVPILSRALTLATRVSAEGPRFDRYENSADPPQGKTDGAVIWDVVFSGFESHWGLHWAVGVYNAFDWRYSLPLGPEFSQTRLPQSGRTFLASGDLTF
jgi:outer membrane receptor for ferrienterochelin and colicin